MLGMALVLGTLFCRPEAPHVVVKGLRVKPSVFQIQISAPLLWRITVFRIALLYKEDLDRLEWPQNNNNNELWTICKHSSHKPTPYVTWGTANLRWSCLPSQFPQPGDQIIQSKRLSIDLSPLALPPWHSLRWDLESAAMFFVFSCGPFMALELITSSRESLDGISGPCHLFI